MTDQMQAPQQTERGGGDLLKLVAATIVVLLGFVGFYYLSEWPIWARWLVVLAALVGGALVALQSRQGAQFWQFVQSSRIELRKVVWPGKDETWKLTGLVFVVVVFLGLFFWALDAGLGMLTRWLTTQGV